MTSPEEALARARARAAQQDDRERSEPAPSPPQAVTSAKLMEWAVIEPEVDEVRSTRRFGAPVTVAKQGLMRLLAQYHAQLTAQQTRFNVNLVAQVRRLEERIEQLERERERDER